MKSSLTSLALVFLVAGTALPTAVRAQADVLKPVHEFMDTFNKGDTKGRLPLARMLSRSSTSSPRSCGMAPAV